ncbi:MAG TPA: Glu/Leu/Phe/Val dehydrogenase dimerization domain-containing protein [Acidimicrobiales bacterium]
MLEIVAAHGAEQVSMTADPVTGLRAIVAIHSTVLGPSLGGTRFRTYDSEDEALTDVLRLARGMTYKHAVCGNDLGGGKAVIIGDPARLRSDEFIRTYARFIDRLEGRYLTAEDVGTTQADMDLIRTVSPYVTGVSERLGGSGDPSPATAWGVLHALYAVGERLWGDASLAGRHIAVSGVGKVGRALVDHLVDAGARVTIADVRDDLAAEVAQSSGAEVVSATDVHKVRCDVFSPCALGAVLNERTIPELQCDAVCGCANNQLAGEEDGERLSSRGVLYAPDFVVNAGGVINIAQERGPDGYGHDRAWDRIAGIGATISRVFALADEHAITPAEAADRLAEERLDAAAAAAASQPS